MSKFWGAGFAILAATSFATAAAPEGRMSTEELLLHVAEIVADPQAREQAIERGMERTALCQHCHGADGYSKRPEIPNLAGQNAVYIVDQIEKFADGRRRNFVMQTLAKDFTDEDKINLAVMFSSMPTHVTETADPGLVARGQILYAQSCQLCHGETGRGEKGYARLAGQRAVYVQDTLKRFRGNSQGSSAVAASSTERHSERMEQVASRLSDSDIEALAAYISQLN